MIFQMTFFPLITTFEYERLFLHRPISNHYSLLVKNITKSNDNIERILMPKQSFPNENIVHCQCCHFLSPEHATTLCEISTEFPQRNTFV